MNARTKRERWEWWTAVAATLLQISGGLALGGGAYIGLWIAFALFTHVHWIAGVVVGLLVVSLVGGLVAIYMSDRMYRQYVKEVERGIYAQD